MAKSNEASPKYLAISKAIQNQIESGILDPGDSLPSLRDYAERFETSASTVQRAFAELEEKGYIETMAGKGTTVSFLRGKVVPDSPIWKVFWSYAQKDDELDKGRITKLKEDIQAEYQAQTGDELNIFQDREEIGWGADWRKAIKENLGATTFFIPVLTPTYLRRPNCLGELKAAIQQFRELGMDEGIYPIEYIDINRQLKLIEDDEVASYLGERQRIRDWRELRFEDRDSSAYRKGIRDIVSVLIKKDEMMKDAFEKLQAQKGVMSDEFDSDDEPGFLERISQFDCQTSDLTRCLEDISETISEIGNIFSGEIIPDRLSPKEAVALVDSIAHRLRPPSEKLSQQGSRYRTMLKDIDKGVSASIELLRLFGSVDNAREMLNSVESLQSTVGIAFSQIDSLSSALLTVEAMSRQFRAPSRKIRAALEDIAASQSYFDGWEAELKGVLAAFEE